MPFLIHFNVKHNFMSDNINSSTENTNNTFQAADHDMSTHELDANNSKQNESSKGHFVESVQFCGTKVTFESGKLAKQTDGSVLVSAGETIVLTTVVFAKSDTVSADFLPLSVNYREMMSAAGKIPGGFLKRESKPTDSEILISRIIDRSVRPLFPKGFNTEVQIISTVLSYDGSYDPSVLAVLGASASLAISGLPMSNIIVGTRIGYRNGKPVFFPKVVDSCLNELDLFVSGAEGGITMMECSSKEIAEEQILQILDAAVAEFKPALSLIKTMKQKIGKPEVSNLSAHSVHHDVVIQKMQNHNIIKNLQDNLFGLATKLERKHSIDNAKAELISAFIDDNISQDVVHFMVDKHVNSIIREAILKNNKRIDGRSSTQIRDISSMVSLLPRSHGSGLFTRGGTQALATVTLGSEEDAQLTNDLQGIKRENLYLHYNFHPYSCGEIASMRAPNRREVNHGYLALRALSSMVPGNNEFPYTVRITSEILESNGSTSQATVCAATLALMDAGVPMKKMVSGIAMGLIKDGNNIIVLSDICGEEDNAGDMDFKVSGTYDGITAIQMDIKIDLASPDIIKKVLEQAKEGRHHILKEMEKTISKPRESFSKYAPIFDSLTVKKDVIRRLIGPGGKVIKEICEFSSSKINIDDSGLVKIFTNTQENLQKALNKIKEILGEEIVLGSKYTAKVVKIIQSGIFVNISGDKDGFVHISEISEGHVDDIRNYITVDQEVKVVVIGVEFGKIRLSIKKYDLDLSDIKEQVKFPSSSPARRFNKPAHGGGGSGAPRGGRGGSSSYSSDSKNNSYRDRYTKKSSDHKDNKFSEYKDREPFTSERKYF